MNALVLALFFMIATAVDGSAHTTSEDRDGATTETISPSGYGTLEIENTSNSTKRINTTNNAEELPVDPVLNSKNISSSTHRNQTTGGTEKLANRDENITILRRISQDFRNGKEKGGPFETFIRSLIIEFVPSVITRIFRYSENAHLPLRILVYTVLFAAGGIITGIIAAGVVFFPAIVRIFVVRAIQHFVHRNIDPDKVTSTIKYAVVKFDKKIGLEEIIKDFIVSVRQYIIP